MTDAAPFVDQPVEQPVDLVALRSQVDSEIAARRVQDVASARLIERLGFQVGGVRLVIVPPAVGYGATAQSGIPANSVLVFQVQLADVQ